MHDPRLSALFERYRSQGDLSALAKLFDEISPEMMRVARHVAGRGVDPEDVVQATFLASIERSETYDASRPIVPWLMGILINQARLMNRRRATRHEEPTAHDIPSSGPEPDDAEAREVQDAVARALADLPPTYREVLVAHLAEGKPPHEIARELGRPQGTVRAQLHRGLRLVRRSLPSGFAFGAAAVLDRSALAEVRREILESAARAKSLPASAIPAATTATNIPASVALGALVLVAILSIVWVAGGAAPAGEAVALDTADAPRARVAAVDRPESQARAAVSADIPAAPASATAGVRAANPEQGSVRVIVRDALGAPAAGVRVDLLAWGDPFWFERVRELVTDGEGAAEFPRVHAGRVGVHVDRGGVQSRADVRPAQRTDIEIRLARGLDLSGIVRDLRGAPIEGAVVEAGEDPEAEPRRVSAPTGPDGRYVLRDVARNLAVWARGDARPASEATWFGTPTWGRKAVASADFVLADPVEPLAFVVVDPRGDPIPGALAVGLATVTEGDASAAFRADGALALAHRAARARATAEGLVSLCLDRAHFERIAVSGPGYAPRELDLDDVGSLVALGPAARLAGVARFGDGAAADACLVEARVEGIRAPLRARSSSDGSWELLDVPPGEFVLQARASPDAPASEVRGVLVAGETVTWNPTVEHASVIRGVARSAHGGPAVTWLVKAVREGAGEAPILAAWMHAPYAPERQPDLRQCWTDEHDGTFFVPSAPGATYRLELRARAMWNGQVHGALDGVAAGATGVDLRVQSERGFVRARFVDAQGRPAAGTLTAVRRGSGAEHHGESQPDGRVERDLHPGTYALVAWPDGGAPRSLGLREIGADEVVELGDVRVDATGQLTLRGAAGASIALRCADGLHYRMERSGAHLVATGLPPGDYVATGRWGDGRALEAAARVEAGEDVVVEPR